MEQRKITSYLAELGESRRGSELREPEAAYMVEKVRIGMAFAEFQALRDMLELTEERMGGLLGMSRATLHRRKKGGILDREESDRLVRYARLTSRAAEALGGVEAAR